MELQNSITEMVGRRYVVIGGQPDIQMRKRDRNRKRRELICEYCGEHKVYYYTNRLTEEQVREIRALQNSGLTQSAVGRKFGVGHNQVRMIWNRTSWAWLK